MNPLVTATQNFEHAQRAAQQARERLLDAVQRHRACSPRSLAEIDPYSAQRLQELALLIEVRSAELVAAEALASAAERTLREELAKAERLDQIERVLPTVAPDVLTVANNIAELERRTPTPRPQRQSRRRKRRTHH